MNVSERQQVAFAVLKNYPNNVEVPISLDNIICLLCEDLREKNSKVRTDSIKKFKNTLNADSKDIFRG